MDDGIKELITQAWGKKVIVAKQYICEPGKSESHVCKKCQEYSNRIYRWPQDANIMPELPIHPHCYCHYVELTANDVRELALAEKRRILEITADENRIQSQKEYSIFNACATQADELASRLYAERFVFWYFRILHGAVTPFWGNITQHHVVSVHPITVNPCEAFILDTWNSWYGKEKDITGNTTVEAWKKRYGYDYYELKPNAEIVDEMNRDTVEKIRRNQENQLKKRKNNVYYGQKVQ